jgi:hypothetical protein
MEIPASADPPASVVSSSSVESATPSPHAGVRKAKAPATSPVASTLSIQNLLLKIADQNSSRVLRLWTSDRISLPAIGDAKSQERIARSVRPAAKSAEVVTDRLTIPSAKAVSIQAPAPTAPVLVKVVPQASPVAAEPASIVFTPAPAVTIHAEAQPAPAQAMTESKPERLTKDSSGNSWIMLAASGQPSILFAQSNSTDVREFPVSALNTQTPPQKANQRRQLALASQPGTGMVSGFIPAGVMVKVRGAAQVDYFSADGVDRISDTQSERYFVARNLNEGAAVVQMFSELEGDVITAVGVPVVSSTATQVDFRDLQTARIRGNLWNSESPQPLGIAHAEIRLVGFPQKLVITGEDGSFDLGDVQLPRGIATFIEARLPGGYTHRYTLTSVSNSKPLSLFLFSDERIQTWVGSLEGGVSPNSGLIVASVKSDHAKTGRPVVKPMAGSSAVGAETYWLSPTDELQEPSRAPVGRAPYFQWIGVEVNAKSVIAGLQSARGRWIHAEWVPTSPGVVSVLNPAE